MLDGIGDDVDKKGLADFGGIDQIVGSKHADGHKEIDTNIDPNIPGHVDAEPAGEEGAAQRDDERSDNRKDRHPGFLKTEAELLWCEHNHRDRQLDHEQGEYFNVQLPIHNYFPVLMM